MDDRRMLEAHEEAAELRRHTATIAGLYVAVAGLLVIGLLATRHSGML